MLANEAANLLLQAKVKNRPISSLPEAFRPKNVAEAYACQNALTDQMVNTFGGKKVGYKVGCTNKTAQSLLGVEEPFYGSLLSPFVFASSAKLRTNDFLMRVVEPEFAFIMDKSLPANNRPYTQEEVVRAIGSIVPAIEIVDSRFEDWTQVGGMSLIADNACNAAWIHGQPYLDWFDLDLAQHEVNLYVNGVAKRKGSGAMVLGNPLTVVTWLANTLSMSGKGLQIGDFVTTGLTCEVYMARLGDRIKADFGAIGSVELNFVS